MLSQIATDQAIPQQHSAESASAADSGIAAVWLISRGTEDRALITIDVGRDRICRADRGVGARGIVATISSGAKNFQFRVFLGEIFFATVSRASMKVSSNLGDAARVIE
jgi:hypothetical protein